MSGNLGQQAVRSRPLIVTSESLTTIGDFIMSITPLNAERLARFPTLSANCPADVRRELHKLQVTLKSGYRFSCPPDEFSALLRLCNPLFGTTSGSTPSGKGELAVYRLYRMVLDSCGGQLGTKNAVNAYISVALMQGRYTVIDGRTWPDVEIVNRIQRISEDLFLPIHTEFFNQHFTAFVYNVVICRLRLRESSGAGASHDFVPLTEGEMEQRDQVVSLGWTYSEAFLLERDHPPSLICAAREINFYLFDDDKKVALERMHDRLMNLMTADLYIKQHQDELFALDLQALAFAVGSLTPNPRVRLFQERTSKVMQDRESEFPTQASPTGIDDIVAFWILFDMSYDLAQGLFDILSQWVVRQTLPDIIKTSDISHFGTTLALLRKQQADRGGIRGLTNMPLYYSTLTDLMDRFRSLHELHLRVASVMQMPEPVPLTQLTVWSSVSCLVSHLEQGTHPFTLQ